MFLIILGASCLNNLVGTGSVAHDLVGMVLITLRTSSCDIGSKHLNSGMFTLGVLLGSYISAELSESLISVSY